MSNRNKDKNLNQIITKFNSSAGKLMKICVKMSDGENKHIEWLARVFKIAKTVDPLCIITRCADKLWDSKKQILERNVEFFRSELDTTLYIKNDKNKPWLDGIVETIRGGFDILSENEVEYVWNIINEMLQISIEYKLNTEDFAK